MERVNVWVQKFADRKNLMLQWVDPVTGRRKTISAKTSDPEKAEKARADKEYELNHGLHEVPSKMSWERFRETYTIEKLLGDSDANRRKADTVFDAFERACGLKTLGDVTERSISAYTAKGRRLIPFTATWRM